MAEEIHHNGDEAPPVGESVHLPGPSYLPVMTAAGLTLVEHATFQLGLNHLFVFERPPRTP